MLRRQGLFRYRHQVCRVVVLYVASGFALGSDQTDALTAWCRAVGDLSEVSGPQRDFSFCEVARLGSDFLLACGGRVAQVMTTVGLTFFAPSINLGRVRWWFGAMKQFPFDRSFGIWVVSRDPGKCSTGRQSYCKFF